MSPRDDSLRLGDMLAAARDATSFVAGRKESDLAEDRQLTLALLKCVEIIGEAAARIGPETRAQNLSIPWSLIVGMRNRLVHNYFEVVGLHGVCLRVSTQASDKLRRDR